MKGTHLGEFEELVLLTIATLVSGAYSVAICDELSGIAGRDVKLGVVHAVLNRLEEKGFVRARLGRRPLPAAASGKGFMFLRAPARRRLFVPRRSATSCGRKSLTSP